MEDTRTRLRPLRRHQLPPTQVALCLMARCPCRHIPPRLDMRRLTATDHTTKGVNLLTWRTVIGGCDHRLRPRRYIRRHGIMENLLDGLVVDFVPNLVLSSGWSH